MHACILFQQFSGIVQVEQMIVLVGHEYQNTIWVIYFKGLIFVVWEAKTVLWVYVFTAYLL